MTRRGQRTALQEMILDSERVGKILAGRNIHLCSSGNCRMEPSYFRDDGLCYYCGKKKDGQIRDDVFH